jgi:hypothetical protein
MWTALSPHTVSRRAFFACAGKKPMSTNMAICSELGSGPPPRLVLRAMGASISMYAYS